MDRKGGQEGGEEEDGGLPGPSAQLINDQQRMWRRGLSITTEKKAGTAFSWVNNPSKKVPESRLLVLPSLLPSPPPSSLPSDLKNRGGLQHFGHEGADTPLCCVSCPYPRQHGVHNGQLHGIDGHVGPCERERDGRRRDAYS